MTTALALALVSAGCGGGPPREPPDGSLPVPPSCGAPASIRDGEAVDLDPRLATAVVPIRCPDGTTYSGFASTPAQAFRYEVGGTSNRAVTISTANDQTAVATDTVIAIFSGECDASRVALACFDDTRAQGRYERRANGTVLARAGESLTILVGYYAEGSGQVRVDVSSRDNRAPDVASAETLFLDDRVLFWVDATDPDGDTDVAGLEIAFVGELGELVRVDGQALRRIDAVRVGGTFEATLGVVDVPDAVRSVLVRAVDAAGVPSESSVTAARTDGSFVGITEPCDGPRGPQICLGELECATTGGSAGTCQPSATVTAACSEATAVTLTMGMGQTRVGHASVTIEPGAGFLRYPFEQCPEGDVDSYTPRTQGHEGILSFTIPEGRWDVLGRSSGTEDLDTILYFRTACGDPESTIGCADDIDASSRNYYSALEVRDVVSPAAGMTVALVAELWDGPTGTLAESFDMDITLRPVRSSGESCDTAFQLDRCAGTPCRSGTCP
ncbi:MAG: hypothetical protein U0353_16160 [Sandaracinus sp.]